MSQNTPSSRFVTAQDGLRLHVRSYGPRTDAAPAGRLPAGTCAHRRRFRRRWPPRWRAIRNDRGACSPSIPAAAAKSDYDRNPANYNLAVELADLIAVLTALGIARAVFVGTSRGGLLTMLLAVARPTAIAGCVLNDIGPVIDLERADPNQELRRQAAAAGELPRRGRDPAAAVRPPVPQVERRRLGSRSRAGPSRRPTDASCPITT